MAKHKQADPGDAADPKPAGPTRAFTYEVHNPVVGFQTGVVHAPSPDAARAAVERWLTAGVSVTEAK